MTTTYRNADAALPRLLHKVMNEGELTDSRNGKTLELIMQQFTLAEPDMYITFPGRNVSLPAQIAETMWLLAGRNDIEWLSHYLPRAGEFSDDNKVWRGGYGPRLRAWSYVHDGEDWASGEDQLRYIVELLKEDPTTRRAVFTIYNPQIDNQPGKDIPCNNWVHFLPRDGVLHGHVAIRSNDLFWGWSGINAFEWTALLNVVAGLTGMQVGSLTFSISSLHLYERHWDKATKLAWGALSWDAPEFDESPQFTFVGNNVQDFDHLVGQWFAVEALIRDETVTEDHCLTAIHGFPEPLLRSWLWALYAWNKSDVDILSMVGLEGTKLHASLEASPKRKKPEPEPTFTADELRSFTEFATELHHEKHKAYGDSWKKRGEMLGIMANCARKVDRLGVAGGGDSSADTAIDLLMYLIKYDLWLDQQKHADWQITEGEPHEAAVADYLKLLANESHFSTVQDDVLIDRIKSMFDDLENLVTEKREDRNTSVKILIAHTYPLAVRLWLAEKLEPKPADFGHAERNATRSWNPEA